MSDSSQQRNISIQQLLSNIIRENTIPEKVISIKDLFQNYIQIQIIESIETIETCFKEVLIKVLPEITAIQQSIFQHNNELVSEDVLTTSIDNDIVLELEEYLKLAIEILNVIQEFLSALTTNGVLGAQNYCFIPINVNGLVCATFYHCKESQMIYKNYFNELHNFSELFKVAHLIHQKLLISIEKQFVFDLRHSTEQQECLLEVIDGLSDTGNILFGFNSKLMATTWRCYAMLIKQYGAHLTNFELTKPLMSLFGEVSFTLKKTIQASKPESESEDLQTFKICDFLIRIATTIIFTFWTQCALPENSSTVFGLITNLYKITQMASQENANVKAKLCDERVHAMLDPILVRFFIDPTPLIIKDLRQFHDCQGFTTIVKAVMPRAKISNTHNATCNVLKLFFEYLKTLQNDDEDFNTNYSVYLTNFTATVLGVSEEEFYNIEEVLLTNTLQPVSITSMFSCDLWILILSLAPPTLRFNTLTSIAEKCKSRLSGSSTPDFRRRSAWLSLRVFLRRCFAPLPDTLKARWFEAFKAEEHLNLWALFGVGEAAPLARREYLAQVIARNVCRRSDRMDFDDLLYAFDGLEVLSGLCTPNDSLSPETQHQLNVIATRLFRTDKKLLECSFYRLHLTESLLPFIVNFIENLRIDNAHLLQILTILLNIEENTETKLMKTLLISVIITAISKTSPDEYNALVFAAIAKLFKILKNYKNSNSTSTPTLLANNLNSYFSLSSLSSFTLDAEYQTVNLYANTARATLEANAEWMKNLANFRLEEKVVDVFKPQIPKETPTVNVGCDGSVSRFEDEGEPKPKKMKLQKSRLGGARYMPTLSVGAATTAKPEDEVQDILDNMKDGVKRLEKLARNGKWAQVSKENSQDVYHVVSKLQQLMYKS